MRAHRWRAYIKPFNAVGELMPNYIEVTEDVDFSTLSTIDQDLDNTDYNIGIYRTNNVSASLRNDEGFYSDVGSPNSIFQFKRSGSLFKVTYTGDAQDMICGFFKPGNITIAEEQTVFEGLIDDESMTMDLSTREIQVTVLGKESTLADCNVPFDAINDGDLASAIIYACLNQSTITNVLTVDMSNINVGTDGVVDVVASLQNKTVQAALDDFLLITNSVLFVKDDTIFVTSRAPSMTTQFEFNGESSIRGAENIQDIQAISSGTQRIFNYLYWTPSNQTVQDLDSVVKYGSHPKEFNFDYITTTATQAAFLASILSDFKDPKQEFTLFTPLSYATLALNVLDKISIDFPPRAFAGDDPLPICGLAICGEAVLPKVILGFVVSGDSPYKIVGRSVDSQNGLIQLKMRLI